MAKDFLEESVETQLEVLDFINVLRDSLGNGVVCFNERCLITAFSPRAEQILGLSSQKMLGQSLSELPDTFQEVAAELLQNAQPVGERRLLLDSKKVLQISATPTFSEPGRLSGGLLVFSDISWVKKWEANLRHADRLNNIGTLTASMAHEIKNAFVAVRTFVDLLLEKNRESELVEVVRNEMRRIDAIIRQITSTVGPVKPTHTSQNLHRILTSSLVLIRHLLDAKKLRLERAFNAQADVISGDSDQLEQALLNLFFNAMDAMAENGRLQVSTELLPLNTPVPGLTPAPGKQILRLTISDTGGGIPVENLARLFEPFFTTKTEGTGLGLAITRRIIEEHHGVITVQSELGKGTSFHIFFPVNVA